MFAADAGELWVLNGVQRTWGGMERKVEWLVCGPRTCVRRVDPRSLGDGVKESVEEGGVSASDQAHESAGVVGGRGVIGVGRAVFHESLGRVEGWRTQAHFRRGQSLQDDHGAAALGAGPRGGGRQGESRAFLIPGLLVLGAGGKSAGRPRNWKQSGKRAARRRWARKPKWRMRTKPGGSTWSRKRRKNSSTARVIRRCWLPCAESLQRKVTWLPSQGDQAVIGDRHAVGVAAEITENMFGTTEGRLAVDHPVLTEEGAEERSESLRFRQKLEVPVEAELAVVEGLPESGDKLAAEDSTAAP